MDFLKFVVFCSLFGFSLGVIYCKDDSNKQVDWFVIYKLPKLSDHSDPEVVKGTGMLYADANSKAWTLLENGITSKKQPIAYTLEQFYDSKGESDVLSILYSDQAAFPTNYTTVRHGHAKGVLTFDANSGFWLIHSMPRFPRADKYEYPESAQRYGQMVLCISTPYKELASIVEQLFYNRVYVYYSSLPNTFAEDIPQLQELLIGKYQKKEPYTRVAKISTRGKTYFKSFAKTGKFGKDLYADFVAPELESSLGTETWQNGGRNLPSICDAEYTVHNIDTISIGDEIEFSTHKDHSKFAVSMNDESSADKKYWICVGDVNRQLPQLKRGGGTVCLSDKELHAEFEKAVQKLEDCPI